MTTIPYAPALDRPEHYLNASYRVRSWLLTVDHKRIAVLYMISVTFFFIIGGIAAVIMRLELMTPAGDLVQAETYNKLFTAHGVMMVFFFHAARIAMIAFDPYLGSKPLANALAAAPPGKLIEADAYYAFSSVFFYTNRRALLLNGRVNNLEYGSYAPDAPRDVFIDDREFERLWHSGERYYLVAEGPRMARLANLLGNSHVLVKASGGKLLFTNF